MTVTSRRGNPIFSLVVFIAILHLGCSKEDPTPTPIDPAYFEAFSIRKPNPEFLYDTISNLVYVFSTDNGEAVSYDYKNYRVSKKATGMPKIFEFELAAGRHHGQPEVYLGIDRIIRIYDGITLTLKDNIQLFNDVDSRAVVSLEWQAPNLIFAGACNSESGTYAINRELKKVTGHANAGGYCQRLRSYHNTNSNLLEVIDIGLGQPNIVIDQYSESGEFVDAHAEFFPQVEATMRLLKTHDDADYFINDEAGNIFSKDSLKFLGSLNGIYNDVVIHEHGNKILALSTGRALKIFSYPSLQVTESIMLKAIPVRGFIDEG